MIKEVKFTEEQKNKQRELLRINIEKANKGDDDALEMVFKSLDYIINSLSKKYYIENHTIEDNIQIAKIGIYEGIKTFDVNKNISPKSFLKTCAERRIQDMIKYYTRDKRKELFKSWSLDAPINDSSNDKNIVYLKDTIEDEYSLDRIIENKEIKFLFEEKIYPCMSDSEKNCIRLYIDGYSHKDIAQELSITPKQVDNAIQRACKKIKKNDYAKKIYFK